MTANSEARKRREQPWDYGVTVGNTLDDIHKPCRDEMSDLRAMVAMYEQTLWDIYTASGADTDGDITGYAVIAGMGRTGYARMVLDAVRDLAGAHDEALNEGTFE